jgi:hypothetical protein
VLLLELTARTPMMLETVLLSHSQPSTCWGRTAAAAPGCRRAAVKRGCSSWQRATAYLARMHWQVGMHVMHITVEEGQLHLR